MSHPDPRRAADIARGDAALQRRARGPHPLQHFLALALETAVDGRERLADVLAGIRAYQAHPYRRDQDRLPVAAAAGAARLLDYGGDGPAVVFVPSLINPPTVLDLAPDNSMLRWLAAQHVRPLLLDWGTPGPTETELDIDGHVTERLLPLMDMLGEQVSLAGYCLGGTMAVAAARLRPVGRLALIATPWRFGAYDLGQRQAVSAWWTAASAQAAPLGAMPMDLIQPLFWALDRQAAPAKFAAFGRMDPDSPAAQAFVALEDWANDGPALSLLAARQCFEAFFHDDLPGTGAWWIDDVVIDPALLAIPVASFVSARDRIVPAAAAPEAGTRTDIAAGHVGMVVGSRAKALLWEPLRDFLTG